MARNSIVLRSAYLVAALATAGVAISTYAAKGKPSMPFDEMYHQALKKVMASPDVLWRPCFPTVGQRDYRYRHCFTEMSGSAALTMRRMGEALEQAGFKRQSVGSESGELDFSYIAESTPYSVNLTFRDTGIEWMAYNNDTGLIPSRKGHDQGASYALADPIEVGRQVVYELLREGGVELEKLPSLVQPCGEANERHATVCAKPQWTPQQARQAIINKFFSGEEKWFSPLDKRSSFEYRQEPLIREMIAEKSIAPGYKSPLLFKKLRDGVYSFHDGHAWPTYDFELHLPAEGRGGQVKVMVRRHLLAPGKA